MERTKYEGWPGWAEWTKYDKKPEKKEAHISSQEEWQEAVRKHMDRLERYAELEFAYHVINEIVCHLAENHYTRLGFIEFIKLRLQEEAMKNNHR